MAMRRAAIAALGVAVLAAGCGSSGTDQNSPEVRAIKRVYAAQLEAVKRGDAKTACALLTPRFQRRAARFTAITKRSLTKGASCEKTLKVGTLRGAIRGARPTLIHVVVHGSSAWALHPAQGSLGAQKVLFRRIGGEWRIAGEISYQGGPLIGG